MRCLDQVTREGVGGPPMRVVILDWLSELDKKVSKNR
jgi:hypothetical protein